MELTRGRVSHSDGGVAAAVVFTNHPTLHGCCDLGGVTLLFVDTKTWRGNNGK